MKYPHVSKNLLFNVLLFTLIILFLFLTLGSIFIGHLSLTYDEPAHFNFAMDVYGGYTNTYSGEITSQMPFTILNILPVKLMIHFWGLALTDQLMIFGRVSTVIVSLLLGLLCFLWVRTLYGKWIGLLGFGLYVFEPNIIAHSQLITTDIYAAATVTMTLFMSWKFLESPSIRSGFLLGLALGLCQIAKITGLLLYPILLLLVFIRFGEWLVILLKRKDCQKIKSAFWRLIKYGSLILVTSIFIINLAFLFKGTGTRLGAYQFKSDFFRSIQNVSHRLHQIPIPLPSQYISTVDNLMWIEKTADDYGNIYLLGDTRKSPGFPGYFIIAFLLKVPIPILALLLISIWDWIRSFRKEEFIRQDMFLLIPTLIYSIYYNFFFQAQTGIRYLLVIFPVLLIFSTRIFRNWVLFTKRSWLIACLAGCYLIISVLSYFPNYLSYFNEFVLNRSYAYRYLADSNLDWGQNRDELKIFLSEHPDYIFQPYQPTAGIIVVGVNELVGVVGSPDDFRWLRENFKPIGNFRNSYLIFDIPPMDLGNFNKLRN